VKRTAAKLDAVVERTLAEHEGNRVKDGEAHDLLDDLLSIYKDGDQGFKLDRTDLKALILVSFPVTVTVLLVISSRSLLLLMKNTTIFESS
jgi:hypothetical protein